MYSLQLHSALDSTTIQQPPIQPRLYLAGGVPDLLTLSSTLCLTLPHNLPAPSLIPSTAGANCPGSWKLAPVS